MTTVDPAALVFSDVSAYLNGTLIHSGALTMPWWLDRAASVGNHQWGDWGNYDGLVYEPRISLGALDPSEFTVVAPASGLSAPDSVTDSTNGSPISLTVTVSNGAGTAYNVTGTSYAGADASDFSDTTVTPLNIPAGGSDDVLVDFTPSGGGLAEATLTLATDDPNHATIGVALSVEVRDPEIQLAASSLAFGSFPIPPGPTPMTVDVDNFGESTALTLTLPATPITGAGAAAYSVTMLPASIAAGGFDQVEVTFNLGTVGVFPAQLSLDTNDLFNPTITVNLNGEVTAVLGGIDITVVSMVSPTRVRIDFEGVANTAYDVKSSTDLATSPFTGAVTPAVDGLTTNDIGGGRGVGFVEIDITVPGSLFFQIQSP